MHRVVSLAGFSLACIQWCSIGLRLLEAPTLANILAVNPIHKNGLPPVAPIHNVVNGARILYSHRARHERKVTNRPLGEAEGEPGGRKALLVIGQARGSGGSAFAAAARHRAAECGSRNKLFG